MVTTGPEPKELYLAYSQPINRMANQSDLPKMGKNSVACYNVLRLAKLSKRSLNSALCTTPPSQEGGACFFLCRSQVRN